MAGVDDQAKTYSLGGRVQHQAGYPPKNRIPIGNNDIYMISMQPDYATNPVAGISFGRLC